MLGSFGCITSCGVRVKRRPRYVLRYREGKQRGRETTLPESSSTVRRSITQSLKGFLLRTETVTIMEN